MCLLVMLWRVIPGYPLVVASNRDEWLERPAVAMTSLSEAPRIRGGRDQRAGGTWLATSESGLVAGLTNVPMIAPPAVPKRSRGELPLLLARSPGALDAARALQSSIRSEEFNPCWILCGDREALAYIDLSTAGRPRVESLAPGIHVLENHPLGPSPKSDFVRAFLGNPPGELDALTHRLESLLASHEIPHRAGARGAARPLETGAACVHAGPYGTRSAQIVVVSDRGAPRIRFTAGPSCTNPWQELPAELRFPVEDV
ncbi:MAG: NRDE family protein [Vicinamibacterales bacterium]